jgi:hypothetical protein
MGVPAIGPPEYLDLMQREALPLDPDLVVINVFVGNDIAFLGRDVYGTESWLRNLLDRESLLVANVPQRVWKLRRERAELDLESRTRAAGGPGADADAPEGPAHEHQRIEDREELLRQLPWLSDPLLDPPQMSTRNYMGVELARARELCASGPEFFAPFFRVMEETARQAGPGKLAVLLIPDEFQVEDELWRTVVEALGDGLERDRPQRWIAAWCEERGIPCEDLLPRLRALPAYPDGWRHAYRTQETHFNAIGNRVAGEGLAALVQRSL